MSALMRGETLEVASARLTYWMIYSHAFMRETYPLPVGGSMNDVLGILGVEYGADPIPALDELAKLAGMSRPMHRKPEEMRF